MGMNGGVPAHEAGPLNEIASIEQLRAETKQEINVRIAGLQRTYSQHENRLKARIAQLQDQLRSAGIEPVKQEAKEDE